MSDPAEAARRRIVTAIVGVALLGSALVLGLWGPGPALLVLAGGALVLVLVLFWSSLESLAEERSMTLEEALDLAAPTVEEDRKRAVFRALKDLEYERTVGKISDGDYQDLSARYREEAKELLRAVDADLAPHRAKIEKALAARLETAGLETGPDHSATPGAPARRACPSCESDNDLDALFCKKCGARVAAEAAP